MYHAPVAATAGSRVLPRDDQGVLRLDSPIVHVQSLTKIYNDFAELEQNILDTLRQSFVAVPTVRLVRRKNDIPPE